MRLATVVQIAVLLWLNQTPLQGQTLEEARKLHVEGALRAALEAYRRVTENHVTTDPATAATAHNNACVIHNGFAEFQQARTECSQALELWRHLGDDLHLARTLNNFAIAQQNLGDYASARVHLDEALEINSRRGDAQAQVLNLSNLGALAILAGNHGRALELHGLATELARRHESAPWAEEQLWIAAINRGVVLERIGAFREALDRKQDGPEPHRQRSSGSGAPAAARQRSGGHWIVEYEES